MNPIFRPGTPADSPAIFQVLVRAFNDLNKRLNLDIPFVDPASVERFWQRCVPLFDYLARTDSRFFVAEADRQVVGYARSIDRDGVRELTEFFVAPDNQSAGVGRELLARAFPADGIGRKFIIATVDSRAQARYLKSGVYPRFPIQYLYRKPEAVHVATDLAFVRVTDDTPETLAALGRIDQSVLGFVRSQEHRFLLADREGYLLRRGGETVGYVYLGKGCGPIALLDADDLPAVLAYAENAAAERGDDRLSMEVPMINRVAVDYLLGRGFRIDPFLAFFMSNEPMGNFEQYICTGPPFFI